MSRRRRPHPRRRRRAADPQAPAHRPRHAGLRGRRGGDGRRAPSGCSPRGPDLIILDLGLPDVSGHELLRRWRAAGSATPIVILSSRTDEAGIVEALELGADDYVTKPFGMKELVARIRAALRHRLQQQGEQPRVPVGDLSVDLVRRIVQLGDDGGQS